MLENASLKAQVKVGQFSDKQKWERCELGSLIHITGVRDTLADLAYTSNITVGVLGFYVTKKHSQSKFLPENEQKKGAQVYLRYIPVSEHNILHLSRKQQCEM